MTEPLDLMLALAQQDTREVRGPGINPIIASLYETLGLDPKRYQDDTSPWCAIACNAVHERAGWKRWPRVFAARGALAWGAAMDAPRRGCVVVLDRVDPSQPNVKHGHVTLYMGPTEGKPGWFDGCGGNQHNRVCVASYEDARVVGWRVPTVRL